MLGNYVEQILNIIDSDNSKHATKIRKNIIELGDDYIIKSNSFFKKYVDYLERNNKTLNYGVHCYLKMINDMLIERIEFIRNGCYSSSSFVEVENRVYANPDIMKYHMHGLVIAQFLWIDQFKRLLFFSENIKKYLKKSGKYLEIGGGHGLYINETINNFPNLTNNDLVDISSSSLELAKGIINNSKVNYIHKNIFDFDIKENTYNFITMGEVLEHVEDPLSLLKKLHELLDINGVCYVTTPINAPMIDHIYLFNDASEIRNLFRASGFEILQESIVASDNKSEEYAKRTKLPVMYAAFLKKNNYNKK